MLDFTTLYTQYRAPIYQHLLHRTHSPEQAEDLTQETFLKALRAQAQVDECNIRGWLFTIAMHTFIDAYRKSKLIALCSLETPEAEQHTTDYDHEAHLDRLARLRTLPRSDRAALVLVASGYSYDEAAIRLGLPIDVMRMRICRARKRLEAAS